MKRYERVDLHNIVSENSAIRQLIRTDAAEILNTASSENIIDIISKGVEEAIESDNKFFNEEFNGNNYEYYRDYREGQLSFCINNVYWNIIAYVHFDILNINLNQLLESLRIITTAGQEYFFGKWRNECHRQYGDPPGPPLLTFEETLRKYRWRSEFRITLIASMFLKNDSLTKRLMAWVNHNVNCERGHYGTKIDPTDIEYYMLFRGVYCNEVLDNENELKQAIRNQKRCKRNKMLLDCLEMIQEGNAKQFIKSFLKYLKHDRKYNILFSHPDSPRSPAALMDLDSTIMWNFALRKLENCTELPEEFMDYIITPDSLHLPNDCNN